MTRIPLLSVCLITFNHQKYIHKAIEGVLMQKVNFDWELIIADDFSTDDTRKILQEYQDKHPNRIQLILQEKNVGPTQNWTDLITVPKSKYIAYFEGDDYWTDPNKLQKQVDILEANKHCSFCFHKAFRTADEKMDVLDFYPKNIKNTILTATDFFKIPTIPTASIVFRNGVTFPELNHSHGDFLLYCALLSTGKAAYIDEEMAVHRLHPFGVSSKYNENWYLERRIDELAIEKKFSMFSKNVRCQIDAIFVDHVFHYVNKNRGKLNFKKKSHYFRTVIVSKYFYKRSLKEYLTFMKTMIK